jgi:hypothetical protein
LELGFKITRENTKNQILMVSPDNLLALLEGHNYYQFNPADRELSWCVYLSARGPAADYGRSRRLRRRESRRWLRPVPCPGALRRNKALDPTALVGCPQASLLPSAVLAGQRRDYLKYEHK